MVVYCCNGLVMCVVLCRSLFVVSGVCCVAQCCSVCGVLFVDHVLLSSVVFALL